MPHYGRRLLRSPVGWWYTFDFVLICSPIGRSPRWMLQFNTFLYMHIVHATSHTPPVHVLDFLSPPYTFGPAGYHSFYRSLLHVTFTRSCPYVATLIHHLRGPSPHLMRFGFTVLSY